MNGVSVIKKTVYPLRLIFCVFLVNLVFSSGAVFAQEREKPYFTDIGQFNYAKFLMNDGEYTAAAREFARLIENFPGSPFMAEAQFKMAEAYLKAGLYRDAEAEFKLFISNFIENPLAIVATRKLEEAQEKLKKKQYPVIPAPDIMPSRRQGLKAVQVMFFEGKSVGEIENEIIRLKDSGVDTIIVRVFHNSGDRYYPFAEKKAEKGVYFRTAHAPFVDDILHPILEAAHRSGIKVFAWMTTRYADYGIEEKDELSCKAYDMETGGIKRCKGLDLFNEKAIKRLESIYSDLADYAIDGILFQDDLVLRHNEGYGRYAEALFRKDIGLKLDPSGFYLKNANGGVHYSERFWVWASWKNRRLLTVAERLRDTVKKKNPEIKFALNLMYESVTNPPFALAWLSQNLEAAKSVGFDYYSIMAYHRQMGEELGKGPEAIKGMIGKMVEDAVFSVGEPDKVLIKLQTVDWKTGKPLMDGEVVELIRDIKETGGVSLAVVPYRGDFPFYELGGGKNIASLD